MQSTIYENVKSEQSDQVKSFAASIDNSTYHWHIEHELICVLEGSVNIIIQGKEHILHAKDMLWINSREIHSIHSSVNENNLCMILQIDPELLMTDQKETNEIRFYLDSSEQNSEEIPKCGYDCIYRHAARIVYETMNEDKHAVFRRRAEIYSLIADLFENVVYELRLYDNRNKKSHELTVDIIDYFEKHLSEENLEDMTCRQFGISRKSLERNLKETLDTTSKHMIDELRTNLAMDLLKHTNNNMNYILDNCGFGSEKTFYRLFKKYTGLTPGEFRQKGQLSSGKKVKGYLDYETPKIMAMLEQVLEITS